MPAWADRQPLLNLLGSVLAERGNRRGVQRQRPAALGGLRLRHVNLVVDDHPWPAG
jgi:hypothetical protein